VQNAWIDLAYLAASVLFIVGLKELARPRTAVRGNSISAVGMLVAIVATCFVLQLNWWIVISALIVGCVVGSVMAIRAQMTAMPQLVALFNGLGGGASVFVAWAEAVRIGQGAELFATDAMRYQTTIAIAAAGLIGAVTLAGSLIAFGKLEEFKSFKKPVQLPAHQLLNVVLALICIALGVAVVLWPGSGEWIYPILILCALALGIMLVIPIGGADMPVVIALLNSYSGLAGAATGFVISNTVLIIAGSLVGASGIILSSIMCKAMNRSLVNVLFGRIEAGSAAISADDLYAGKIKQTTAEEVAMLLEAAQRVAIVPGYGMAVARAQQAVYELYQLLEKRGVEVLFAIHPVAGRMPGHMNVLLAEVDIPYDKLLEMDTINSQFSEVDVAIVLGANDVVNPDARRPDSAIAGMPILNVDQARTVVVIKRSLSPGFAGISNPLFVEDNTLMYFADGKQAVVDIIAALKAG
jgi:NAD(P) transhydrogenase subunit beta